MDSTKDTTAINITKMTPKEKQDQAKALEVLQKNGDKAFIKHVFTDPETGKPLDYREMRARYG